MTSVGIVRVVVAYTCAYPNPLRVKEGEMVTAERRDCEWPGWIWCRSEAGVEGWLPEEFLTLNDQVGQAELKREVDATELTVAVGDELTLIDEVAGWIRCRAADGSVGWIPADNVERYG